MRILPSFLVFCCLGFATLNASEAYATNSGWQCVTFARSHSGIQIMGNAHTWWDKADGIYIRSNRPDVGAVLVMKSSGLGGMRFGHVATVSKVINKREVLLTHANWNGDGHVETNARAIDVSSAGDWTEVRVWYSKTNAMGLTAYPAYGFILPQQVHPSVKIEANDATNHQRRFQVAMQSE